MFSWLFRGAGNIGSARFSAAFCATVGALLGLCLWITGINKDPYPDPVELGAFARNEILVTNRLDERYRAGLKIRSVERFGIPPVAAFGSHAIKYLTSESLAIAPGGFINLYVMHIGLPGISTVLRKLESSGNFPRDLVLVDAGDPQAKPETRPLSAGGSAASAAVLAASERCGYNRRSTPVGV